MRIPVLFRTAGFSIRGLSTGPQYKRVYLRAYNAVEVLDKLKTKATPNPKFKVVHFTHQVPQTYYGMRLIVACCVPGIAPHFPNIRNPYDVLSGAEHRYGRAVPSMTGPGRACFIRAGARLADIFPRIIIIEDESQYRDTLIHRRGRIYALNLMQISEQNPGFDYARDSPHKSFPKTEPYDWYKWLRSIQGAQEQVTWRYGIYVSLMADIIFHQIWKVDKCLILFVKPYAMNDRPSIIDNFLIPGLEVIGNDHTAFEAHMTKFVMTHGELLVFERMLGTLCPGKLAEWRRLVTSKQTLHYHDFTVTLPAFRASGNSDTSMSNAIENINFFCAACEVVGAVPLRAVVEGDDGVFQAINARQLTSVAFEAVGAEVKMEFFPIAGVAGFCQMYWAPDGSLVPDIRRKLARLWWTDGSFKHSSPPVLLQLYKAKLLSLQSECPGCPVLWAVAHYHLQLLSHVVARRDPVEWYKETTLGPPIDKQPTLSARIFCETQWLIPISLQLALEADLQQSVLDVALINPIWRALFALGAQNSETQWLFHPDDIVSFEPGQFTL